jgi:hypothetical protein
MALQVRPEGLEPPTLGSEGGRRVFLNPNVAKELRQRCEVAVLPVVLDNFPHIASGSCKSHRLALYDRLCFLWCMAENTVICSAANS